MTGVTQVPDVGMIWKVDEMEVPFSVPTFPSVDAV